MPPPTGLLKDLATDAAPTVQLPRNNSPLAPPSGGVPPPMPRSGLPTAYAPLPVPRPELHSDFQDVAPFPPPPPPSKTIPIGPPPIGPQRAYSPNDRNAPMRQMLPINKTMSMPDAQHARMAWRCPEVFPGEPVFYRRHKENDEHMAWIMGKSNQTFTLMVLPGNAAAGPKSSVAYYDPFGPPHENDPMAPHTNAGTFRRTEFARIISSLIAKNALSEGQIVKPTELVASVRNELISHIRILQEQVDHLKRELEAKAVAEEITEELSMPPVPPATPAEAPAAVEAPKPPEIKSDTKNGGKAKGN